MQYGMTTNSIQLPKEGSPVIPQHIEEQIKGHVVFLHVSHLTLFQKSLRSIPVLIDLHLFLKVAIFQVASSETPEYLVVFVQTKNCHEVIMFG